MENQTLCNMEEEKKEETSVFDDMMALQKSIIVKMTEQKLLLMSAKKTGFAVEVPNPLHENGIYPILVEPSPYMFM